MLKKSLLRFLTTAVTTTMLLGNVNSFAVTTTPTYLNSKAPIEDRVKDLLGKMSLDEKVGQMVQSERATTKPEDVKTYKLGSVLSGGGSLPTPNNAEGWANMTDSYQQAAMSAELGIPILYGVDAVHGHNNVYGATIFPHNIGLGAARDTETVKNIGKAVAEEVRATGVNWSFAPTLGIPHNERWGRTYETFGENADLVSQMGKAYIQGLQGDDPGKTLKRTDKVIATAKHYIGEGLTENGTNQGNAVINDSFNADGTVKFNADGSLPEGTLKNELLLPYQAAVEAGARSVMVSYNSINGVKCHGNADLITKVLKGTLKFSGIVVTDYEGIKQISGASQKEKIGKAVNAGIDMAMEPNDWRGFITSLKELVNEGTVSQSRIDDAVSRILKVKFEMGLFEDPYAQRGLLSSVGSETHRDIARQAVRESLVLLKNDNDIVGKLKDMKNILVAGKAADDIGIQCGGWTISWQGSSGNITPGTTILQGIKNAAGSDVKISYSKRGGGDLVTPKYDAAIVVMGETPYAETDGDRTEDTLTLSTDDLTTIDNIRKGNPDLPIIAVLISGRPLTIADQIEYFDGLVEAWLPGTEGEGVGDVLFGGYDFKGKLPITWPWYASDIPNKMTDKALQLFAYGYGLKKGETAALPAKPEKPDAPSQPIPGKIETEVYTNQSGFSFEGCSDVGGGQDAGWTDAGDWLDYYVNVAADGKYEVEFRVASPDGQTGGAELYLGSKLLTKVNIPKTGDWQNWTSVKGTVNLRAGKQTIRFRAGTGGFNFNWMNFVRVGDYEEDTPETPPVITPTGQVLKSGAVTVTMSSAVQPGSQSWYDSPKPIPNTLTKKDNLDITAVDDTQVTTINIDDSKTYQDILGMGTSIEGSSIYNIRKLSPSVRTEFLKKLVDPVNGAGMNLIRVTIGTPDFTADTFHTYDDMPENQADDANLSHFSIQSDMDDGTIEVIKEVLKLNPGVKLFASSWTPPGWMKEPTSSSSSYSNNEMLLKGGKLSDAHIDDLARYYVRYLEEYAKLGIPIYAITLQNEPMLEINYPSCAISSEQERLLSLSLKKKIAESTILKEKNINPLIWAFDHNFDGAGSYVTPILSKENGVDGIAYHPYSGDPSAMTQMHNQFPNVPAYLTERSLWGTKGADEIARYFRNYARSYDAWVVMLDSNISPHQWTGTPDPTMFVRDANVADEYWATPEYYITGQFSKFIQRGAVRIDSNYGSTSTVTNVAFKNPDGSIAAVVINQTNTAQTFKMVNNGIQVFATIPAQNVATYQWNPLKNASAVPGTILAKDFDAKNNANVVDDGADGSHVGGMSTGSWLDYIIDVKEPGLYTVTYNAAAGTWDSNGVKQNTTRLVNITQGDTVLSTASITDAWWGNYKDNATTIRFAKAGIQKIRLNITGAFDLRSIKFENVQERHNLPGWVSGKDFTNALGIVIENGKVGYMDKDDFLEYKVNVAEAGEYDFNLMTASDNAAPSFDVYSDNEMIGTIALSRTNGWSDWQLQSKKLTLKAGEQTLKFVIKEGFNLDYFTVGSSIRLANSSIIEDSINGSDINVVLSDGTFADTLTEANWTLNNLPAGISFNVERVDANNARITLSGYRTVDFDNDKAVTVAMSAKELVGGGDKTYSIEDSFVITANNDKESLSTSASSIPMNTEAFTVTLNGGTFVQDKINAITLSGDMITSGYVKLAGVDYIDSTHIRIKLDTWKARYEDLTLTINVPAEAYSDSNGDTGLTADVTCGKSSTLPQQIVLGDSALSLTEAMAYRVKGSLNTDVVQGNRLDYFLNVAQAGDYTITFDAYNNGSISNALKLSKGNGTNVDGNIATLSMGNFWGSTDSFKDTIHLEAGLQTLRFEAVNTGFSIKAIKIEKKAQPIVISGAAGEKTTIYADSFYKASNDYGYAIETKNNIKNIGCTVVGTWLDYSINAAEAGKYKVIVNYAANVGGAIAVIQTGTGKELARMPLASTGDWGGFADTKPMYITLAKGEQTLRIYVDGDGYNYRTLTFEPVIDKTAPVINGRDGVVEKGAQSDLLKALSISAVDDLDGDITSKVHVDDSSVKYNEIGVYEVKVSVSDDSGNSAQKTFKVTVKEDATAPVITGHNAQLAVGSPFEPVRDLGLKITDNKDGDITSKAVITPEVDTTGNYIFRLRVEAADKAGNTAVGYFVVRVFNGGIIVADPAALKVGDTFNPLKGVKALDVNGEDLTSKLLVISNNVDLTKAGTYKVVYSVVDSEGNTVIGERTVTVTEKANGGYNGGQVIPKTGAFLRYEDLLIFGGVLLLAGIMVLRKKKKGDPETEIQ